MGYDTLCFDFVGLSPRLGREAMNHRFAEAARAEQSDVFFCVLSRRHLDKKAVRSISRKGQRQPERVAPGGLADTRR